MILQWLTVELGEMPKVQLKRSERESILPGYLPLTQFPGSTGHFDWLRTSSGGVMGVKYWPFNDAVHADPVRRLLVKCSSLKYTIRDSECRHISIFFGGLVAEVAENISNDQDIGENGIYENERGLMALCFEVDPSMSAVLERSIECNY